MDFIPYHASTNESLYINLREKGKIIEDLQNQVQLLNKKVLYLEKTLNTYFPVPEEHEILYEKVYKVNPLYDQGNGTLDNPSSKTDKEIS